MPPKAVNFIILSEAKDPLRRFEPFLSWILRFAQDDGYSPITRSRSSVISSIA